MNDRRYLLAILEAASGIPSKVEWNVCAIRSLGCILLTDDRDEATTVILEAIANQSGKIIASLSTNDTASGRELLGCLIQPTETDLDRATAMLRASYALGIGAGIESDTLI